MKKETALQLLGGSVTSAAKSLNITYQAVSKWPDELSPAVSDRVIAAIAKSRPDVWGLIELEINGAAHAGHQRGQP